MAAKHVYLQGFLLLLFNFVSSAASERRFSDFKRCADEECSMLLCRGKALKDFSGPDCRFLSFKESETIYVYYKLSGRRADIWAGSVGSHFGYFPKDLLAVNHIYTEKEFEVPAEETDFVCFDTGFDKFTNYDIDLLLGSSAEEIDNENKEASDQVQAAEEIQKVTEPLVEEEAENEKQIEHHDNLKDLHKAPDDQSASSADLDKSAEQSSVKAVALNTAGAPDAMERAAEADEVKQKHSPESVLEDLSDKSETKDTPAKSEMESVPEGDFISDSEPVTASEGAQIPDLKTTISSTFDAVVTSDEVTKKVTPYEEEDSEDVQDHLENDTDVKEEIPLLSYSEKPMNTPASDSLKKPDSPPATGEDKPKSAEENNTRASLGDALFSAVTGGETTPQDLNSEEKKGDGKQVQIPKLKTTLGTMFDAVITNEEVTKKVTPYEEEDSEDVEENPEIDTDITEEIPLLSYSEEPLNTPESDSLKKPETPPAREKDKPKTAEKNMWTSIGDAVFSAVTGGETTPQDLNSEEKKDDGKQMQIPKLKTTLGTTFDAVITNEDITKKVTPYEEEGSEDVDDHPEIDTDVTEETPLLSFTGEPLNTPESDSLKKPETPPATEDKPKTAEKNMWTSIGDAVFSAVTGVDIKPKDLNSEEDEDDEDQEEEDAVKTHDDIKEEPHPVESPKDLENIVPVLHDRHNSTSVSSDIKEHFSDSEKLLFDDDESDGEVIRPEETLDETVKPAEEQVEHQTEETMTSVDPLSQDDLVKREAEQLHTKPTYKPTEDKDEQEVSKDSEITEDEATIPDSIVASEQDLDNALDENKKVTDKKLAFTKTENYLDLSTEDGQSNELDVKDEENDHLMKENNNSQAELSLEEPEMHEEPHTEEKEDENDADMEEEKEELLEDENALLFSQSDKPSPETSPPTTLPPEPQYSDSIMRLTLLRDHFTEEKMEQFQKLLGLKNLFKVEAMFSDLDAEFEATRQSHADTMQDIENALEGILEASENTILDEIEKMLDSRDTNLDSDPHMDTSSLDEESEILDDFQELAFSLRQKYSTASDSTPLMPEKPSDIEQDEHELNVKEDVPHIVEEKFDNIPETEGDDNLTVTDPEEKPAEVQEEQMALDDESSGPDVSVEEDGGHFNKNKDHPPSFSTSDEMQKLPQDTLENPLDMGLGVEVEQSPSESVDSMEPVSERHEEEVGWFSTGMVYAGCILSMITNKTAEWTSVMISLLPEEWKPGETLFGCPWEAVVITALVGVVTFTLFFWRTVLAVKKREYLVDEQKLVEQIQAHKKEKEAALAKMAELQKQTEQLKENQKQSKETVSCAVKRMQDLENKVLEAETLNKQIAEEKDKYSQLLEEERTNALQNETRIEKLEKLNEKLQVSRKKVQEALAKTTVLLDEAKLREDARNVQQKCQQKEFATLKEENKTLKASIKSWEDKHKELNEKIKVYQKSQKELEDSVVLKDHNVEVLSELLADLDACDLQKSDTKVLANGEVAPTSLTDKKTAIKNRIKQMVDVSRVQTTLTVVEEERDRFMTKLLNEEKSRKALEEQHQELEHAIATLKSEKSHVENQFKILQQKNEIMVEMYQQKENALQQRLTKEELERRSKENLLSEVGGKALEAEEQVKILRQRINEMEEQMKQTEEVYKEQIKEQENKTHSNWVNARNAERALNQEKLESSKLREKLALLTSQLNERRAPLFRPNSGQPAGPRQGDSYGPSPVSGGAPSPPIMIEGPRRPPSAPIGRRIDPYGPRPPSDPHGRYAENKHVSGMDMMGPRSSSPANLDGSGPGSFLTSPIRDSPAPIVHGLQPGSGPHDPMLPPGPTGRLPPPLPYRPGLYALPPGPPPPNVFPPLHGPPLPANGHPGMPLPGPMGGEFGPRPTNGLAMPPRPGPGPVIDPRGPPPPHFRPPPPHPYGPMPPPQGARGPMGPRPPVPPDMRFPGPRDHPGQPMDLPLGVPPHPAHPGDAYGQPAPDALQNSVGAHSGPRQDLHVKQEAPQDSARPAMVKP